MQLPALQQDAVVQALGWVFVHSLWQGLLLAVLAGLVVLLTKNARAGLRYSLLVALVGLFLCAAGFTFVNGLHKAKAVAITTGAPANTFIAEYPVNNVLLPVFTNDPEQAAPRRFIDRFTGYFNTHASLVVIIWFIIFSAKLVKLMANIGYIQRIRYYKTHAPSNYWKEKIQQLANGLQVRQRVQLLQSEIVQVPVVIGALKPVILIPLGIFSQLPAEQVEAVLLHELAHIKRRDYLVNMLQSFTETIFFFNPAVLWVSSLIRDERENCCDDIAVAGTKNKTAFVDALVSFQEYNISVSKYGMAFPGRKNHLLNRVKRILHKKNKTLNTMEKSLLTFSIAIILLLTLTTGRQVQAQTDKNVKTRQAQKRPPAPPPAPAPTVSPVATAPTPPAPPPVPVAGIKPVPVATPEAEPAAPVAVADVAPAPKPVKIEVPAAAPIPAIPPVIVADTAEPEKSEFTHISRNVNNDGKTKTETVEATDRDGKTYRFTRLNDVITSLSVNGVEIPKEQYADYQPVIDRLYQNWDANRERAKKLRQQSQQFRKESKIRMDQMRRDQMEERKWVIKKDVMQKEMKQNQKKLFITNDVVLKCDVVLKKGLVVNDLKKDAYQPIKLELSTSPYVYAKGRKPVPAKTKFGYNDADDLQHQKELMHALIADLVKDGIIKNEKKLESLGLSDTELIVNGKKQPDDVQQKYRAQYIAHPGFGLYYGPVQMTGKGYFLGKEDF